MKRVCVKGAEVVIVVVVCGGSVWKNPFACTVAPNKVRHSRGIPSITAETQLPHFLTATSHAYPSYPVCRI